MHGSATHAALGLIVAGLALAALAMQREVPADSERPAPLVHPSPAKPELRALRDGEPLDVNRASVDEFTLIPGIGPKLAARIVEERTRRGGFQALAELRSVRGLGPKLWLRVEPFVRLTQASNK